MALGSRSGILVAPVKSPGGQRAQIRRPGRIKTTAEVHDYLDEWTGVLAPCSPNAPATPVGLTRTIVGLELSRRAHATWRQAQDTGILGGCLERG